MITLITAPVFFNPTRVDTEYSCSYCFKPIKWDDNITLSPMRCEGCQVKLPNLSSIIGFPRDRVAYHLEVEESRWA